MYIVLVKNKVNQSKDVYKRQDFKQSDYDSYRNTYVGFIFQEFNLMEEYTIEKNIAMALQLQQKEASHADIEEMLKRLGLSLSLIHI